MIFLTNEVKESIENLFYYPYVSGRHLDKVAIVLSRFRSEISNIIYRAGTSFYHISGIGTIGYTSDGRDVCIHSISWNAALTRFYYRKANFITFTSAGNIPSAHPALYTERNEDFFKCDNGFKVISRGYRGRELFNFKNQSGKIISAIDFTQVLPFSRFKDMTARGYTPDKKCYIVLPDGSRMETNEQKGSDSGNKVLITESAIVDMVRESVYRLIHEATINGYTYPTEKQVGNWKCIDGIYWEQEVKGCPEKGLCYDVRMYDNTNLSNGEWETYALWRRVDNGRYFYASIVPSPNKESNQTEWKTTPLTKVPSEILKDFHTLPQPPERVLTNQISRDSADSLQNVIDESSHKGRRIKAYKKICVDTDGGRWPDGMSDQDIQIQNNYMKRYGVTSCSELLPLALKLLSHNKVTGYEHYLSRRRDARNQKQSSESHCHN